MQKIVLAVGDRYSRRVTIESEYIGEFPFTPGHKLDITYFRMYDIPITGC